MTTKLVDNVAMHARLYRLATETVNLALDDYETKPANKSGDRESPQKRNVANNRMQQHRRNKSDTDLNRYLNGSAAGTRNLPNSKFYVDTSRKNSEDKFVDPEEKLINAFFNQCDLYRDECKDEQALEGIFFVFKTLSCGSNSIIHLHLRSM